MADPLKDRRGGGVIQLADKITSIPKIELNQLEASFVGLGIEKKIDLLNKAQALTAEASQLQGRAQEATRLANLALNEVIQSVYDSRKVGIDLEKQVVKIETDPQTRKPVSLVVQITPDADPKNGAA